jgi:hypothetical protein
MKHVVFWNEDTSDTFQKKAFFTYLIPSCIFIPEDGPCSREKVRNVLHIHETKLNYFGDTDSVKHETASKFIQYLLR